MSTREDIYNDMQNQKNNSEVLQTANSTSKTSVINSILYIVSFAIDTLKGMFAIHKEEIINTTNDNERRLPSWYQQLALNFQYGHQLVEGKDYYDNSNRTDDEIEQSKIVKFAVAVEEEDKSTLYIKIADKNKSPLSSDQLSAFAEYMDKVADIGVHITIINENPDNLKLTVDYWYDATLLNKFGKELISSKEPVKENIKAYLSNLNFNEEYVDMRLVDVLQQLPSTKVVEIKSSFYKYKELSWKEIHGRYTPYAGHITIDDVDLQINYIKY